METSQWKRGPGYNMVECCLCSSWMVTTAGGFL